MSEKQLLMVSGKVSAQIASRWQRWLTSVWVMLRSPRLTGILLIILAVVTLVGLLLPQQATSDADASLWITSLPQLVQLWGEPLYLLGFARIFQSPWFWLPVALLLLNSLVALADYAPGSWQRLKKPIPPLTWQHPLATRAEQIVRLPKSPDIWLTTLQGGLVHRRFLIYQPADSDQRLIGAARRRWAWLGVVAVYAGLGVLVGALLVSHYFLQTDHLILWPYRPAASRLFQGEFELAEVKTGVNPEQAIFSANGADDQLLQFDFSLYQPVFFKKIVILPTASEPVLTIEARDSAGKLRKLIPIQADLPPAERLNLPLSGSGEPLYFVIPSAKLALQIIPDPNSGQHSYNVQVRRGSEEVPSETITVQVGESFELDDLSITMSTNRNLSLLAYYDPALPLYLVGLLLVLGGLSTFLPFLSPIQLWLVPEVKGIGGRLYGIVERYEVGQDGASFLEELLALEVAPEGEGAIASEVGDEEAKARSEDEDSDANTDDRSS